MRNRITAAVAFLFVVAHAPQSEASELIGMVVPPFPAGILSDGGACIGKTDATLCTRGVIFLKTSSDRDFLIFSGSAEPSQGKMARWRVIDTLAFPKRPRGYELVFECRESGKPDPSIMAIVDSSSQKDWLPAHGWAYRVDDSTGRFVKLDPRKIDCAYVGEE